MTKLTDTQIQALASNAVKTWYYMMRRVYAFIESSDMKSLGDCIGSIIPISACKTAGMNLEKIRMHAVSIERDLDTFNEQVKSLLALRNGTKQEIVDLLLETEKETYQANYRLPQGNNTNTSIYSINIRQLAIHLLTHKHSATSVRGASNGYERALLRARGLHELATDAKAVNPNIDSDRATNMHDRIGMASVLSQVCWIIPGAQPIAAVGAAAIAAQLTTHTRQFYPWENSGNPPGWKPPGKRGKN